MQVGGALAQSVLASQEHCCKKTWPIVLVKKEGFLVCPTAGFQPSASQAPLEVKGGKEDRVVVLFLKGLKPSACSFCLFVEWY